MPVLFTQSGARKLWSRLPSALRHRVSWQCLRCSALQTSVTPGHSRAFPSLFATRRASRISANSPGRSPCLQLHAIRAAMGFPLGRGSNKRFTNRDICVGVLCLEDHPGYCGIPTPAFQPTKFWGSAFIPKNTPFHRPQEWSTWQWLIIGFTVLPHQLIAPVIHGKTPGLFLKHPSFSLYLLQGAKFIGNQTQKTPCDLTGAC